MPYLSLTDLPSREVIPGFHGKFTHTAHFTLANWEIEAGVSLPEHSHPHEQVTQLLAGEFEFVLDGETRRLTPGMIVLIPPNVRHSARAITPCTVVDVFYPVREDYR
jgi:quercetin dioxygenase-like cupin family protein